MQSDYKISSDRFELIMKDSPFKVESLFLNQERTKVCANGIQQFVIRFADAVSDPVVLTKSEYIVEEDNQVKFRIRDEAGKNFINASITINESGLKYSIDVNAEKPVWIVEWKLSGFNFDNVIIPALGGQKVSADMPDGTNLTYKYPFWWNAQFVLGETSSGCLMLTGRDLVPDLKLLRVSKKKESFGLTYGIEAPAPLKNNKLNAEFYLEYFEGNWKNAVDNYRHFIEDHYELKRFKEHPHYPDWADNIKFILEIWGARKGFKPSHSFSQMIDRIEEFANLYNPANTLLYLPGFAENGIDSNAPDYNPSEQCGGSNEFKRLIDRAHELGYKVMIHTNVLALTYTHRIYNEFRKYQVIDVFNRPQGWAMDIDGDWLTEPFFAYVNPGYKEWGLHMKEVIGELVKEFNIDGVFLDQTLLAFNISKGPNFIEGMRNHVNYLQKSFPQILFAGEGLHEQNVKVLPMAQIHGIDSITDVHGMEDQKPWRTAHPVSTYLFGKYTKYTAHLLTKHPSDQMFIQQEKAYSELGVIPALCLYDSSQKINLPEVKKMIERTKEL